MRYIHPNSSEPALLAQDRRDGRDYDTLRTGTKREMRRLRRADQYGLCAFCCRCLPDAEPEQRLAHIVPRCTDRNRELDFGNLVLSCSGDPDEPRPPTCDRAQRNRALPVHPLRPDCETRVTFDPVTVRVAPAGRDDEEARQTIAVLGLATEALTRARAAALDMALEDLLEAPETYLAGLIGGRGTPYEFAPIIERILGRPVAYS